MTIRKLIPLLFLILPLIAICQDKGIAGVYTYSTEFYNEKLALSPNGQFSWTVNTEFLKLESTGNWQLRSDSLILDSSPQKDKLLVWESRPNSSKQTTFWVTDKMKSAIHYTLYVITFSGDTIVNRNQFKKSIVDFKVKGFYLVDSKGLRSPTYYTVGKFSNRLDILFETKRTFENESWLLQNGDIIPKSADGTIQKYNLSKKAPL